MKKSIRTYGILLTICLLTGSCKKNYTCVCSDPGGPKDVFTTKATKKDAEKECEEYYDSKYGYYFSETFCGIK